MTRRLAVALIAAALLPAALPATAASLDPVAAEDFVRWINRERAAMGIAPLSIHPDLVEGAGYQAWQIAGAGTLFHNSDLGSVTVGWTAIGENVAYAPSPARAHELLMNSPGHRANILGTRYTHVGVGVVNSGGTYWVAQVFAGLPDAFRPPFRDDDGSGHEDDIITLAAVGITTGCGVELFCPSAPVTRGQMATFLSRAMSFPASAVDFFSDDDGSPHEADINALAAAGITTGCGSGSYCPHGAVTRAQMATFLVRAFGY